MKPRDIFGLCVRLIGLIMMYQGANGVPNAITSIMPVFPHFFWRNVFPSLLIVGWPLAVGYYLLRGAPQIMRLAYGEEKGAPLEKMT